VLVALAVALVPAFVYAPGPLAGSMSGGGFGDQRHLIDSLSASFVGYRSHSQCSALQGGGEANL